MSDQTMAVGEVIPMHSEYPPRSVGDVVEVEDVPQRGFGAFSEATFSRLYWMMGF